MCTVFSKVPCACTHACARRTAACHAFNVQEYPKPEGAVTGWHAQAIHVSIRMCGMQAATCTHGWFGDSAPPPLTHCSLRVPCTDRLPTCQTHETEHDGWSHTSLCRHVMTQRRHSLHRKQPLSRAPCTWCGQHMLAMPLPCTPPCALETICIVKVSICSNKEK